MHPVAILSALKTYAGGKGVRSAATWTPVREIVDALDAAFYASFKTVTPTNKRILLGLDVSGSMAATLVNGLPNLPAREACGALALVTASVEPHYAVVAFDTAAYALSISPNQRLDAVVDTLARTGGGGTDCAIPITWAVENKIDADAIVILTDSETWQGKIHPAQAIESYRKSTGIPAKLIVVAMAANRVTVGDTADGGTLNVVGFDAAAPQLIADFIRA